MKKHFQSRAIEWVNGFLLSSWGLYVIFHPGIFSMGPSASLFIGLEDLAPQLWWGMGAFIIGNIRLVSLFINGQWGLTPLIRVITSFLSVFVWFWICVGLSRSGIPQVGLALYPGLMLADMLSAFRAASDAYEAEALKRLQHLSRNSPNVTNLQRR